MNALTPFRLDAHAEKLLDLLAEYERRIGQLRLLRATVTGPDGNALAGYESTFDGTAYDLDAMTELHRATAEDLEAHAAETHRRAA